MKEIAERLKKFREENQISQEYLATKLGLLQSAIAMVENEKRKAASSLKLALLKVYGYDIDEDKYIFENGIATKPISDNIISVPFYSAKAAAGKGEQLAEFPEKDVMHFDGRWLKNVIGLKPEHASIIQAKGDSMDSGQNKIDDIKDGDLLLIDDSINEIINGKIFVVELNSSELVVKKINKEFDGTVSLISNNLLYPVRTLKASENARIIGRVVWNGSKESI